MIDQRRVRRPSVKAGHSSVHGVNADTWEYIASLGRKRYNVKSLLSDPLCLSPESIAKNLIVPVCVGHAANGNILAHASKRRLQHQIVTIQFRKLRRTGRFRKQLAPRSQIRVQLVPDQRKALRLDYDCGSGIAERRQATTKPRLPIISVAHPG